MAAKRRWGTGRRECWGHCRGTGGGTRVLWRTRTLRRARTLTVRDKDSVGGGGRWMRQGQWGARMLEGIVGGKDSTGGGQGRWWGTRTRGWGTGTLRGKGLLGGRTRTLRAPGRRQRLERCARGTLGRGPRAARAPLGTGPSRAATPGAGGNGARVPRRGSGGAGGGECRGPSRPARRGPPPRPDPAARERGPGEQPVRTAGRGPASVRATLGRRPRSLRFLLREAAARPAAGPGVGVSGCGPRRTGKGGQRGTRPGRGVRAPGGGGGRRRSRSRDRAPGSAGPAAGDPGAGGVG